MKSLAAILIAAAMLSAQPPAAVKEKALLLPPGTMVEVRTVDKKKFRGRIGAVSDSGFEFQRVQGSQLINERMPFDRVASLGERRAGRIVMAVLATIGACVLIIGIFIGG